MASGVVLSADGVNPYGPAQQLSADAVIGTPTGDNANAGFLGEYQSNSTSNTGLTTGAPANATSISLTAGDWDVQGVVQFSPGATTTIAQQAAGISSTSATFGGVGTYTSFILTFSTGTNSAFASPVVRISLSSAATVYCVAMAQFGVSTMTCNGFIRARRVR